MNQPLQQQEPEGNVGLLLYRVAEHVAVNCVCPQEWPLFQPYVERWFRERFA